MTHRSDHEAPLTRYLIDDAIMAAAYESTGPVIRTSLKKNIARLYRIWGKAPSRETMRRSYPDGFGYEQDATPAPFVLCICNAEYTSSAAFVAAIMPAVLAGVERIIPFFIINEEGEAGSIRPPLLAALELAGVEQAFCCSGEELPVLLRPLGSSLGRGRLLQLGSGDAYDQCLLEAVSQDIPFYSLSRQPYFYSHRVDASLLQRDADITVDASADTLPDEEAVSVSLDANHEDVWIWPELTPQWFLNRRVRLYSIDAL